MQHIKLILYNARLNLLGINAHDGLLVELEDGYFMVNTDEWVMVGASSGL